MPQGVSVRAEALGTRFCSTDPVQVCSGHFSDIVAKPVIALPLLALAPVVTFASLLREMTDLDRLSRLPEPSYSCLQASSYNRESVERGRPGWFADSDGTGFIRTETRGSKTEWVVMEHTGPGCITKLWTPFFYYDFNDRRGPNIRVYLDGSETPVIDEPFIDLVQGRGSIPPPLAFHTARAGDSYLPIPFAKSAKVTMTGKPFYHLIQYRAYQQGTRVETFRPEMLAKTQASLPVAAATLESSPVPSPAFPSHSAFLKPRCAVTIQLPKGPGQIVQLCLKVPSLPATPELLRQIVLKCRFDGVETIWCPIGDFFCSADSLHPFRTLARSVNGDGTLVCRWRMPYRTSGSVTLENTGPMRPTVYWEVQTEPRAWDTRSMHFYSRWRPDDVVPGTPFQDWNFVDIQGWGVYVGDAWTVLNPRKDSWWGEGDEKVYVDGAWGAGFPTHFGTGTEDYYGWAGGVLPTREDEFSSPFLANVRVGGLDGYTRGFNICTRERGLDAIPFARGLRFDMEASFGTDMREPWDLLGYSAVTFWYARPGAVHNRTPVPAAGMKLTTLTELERRAAQIRKEHGVSFDSLTRVPLPK